MSTKYFFALGPCRDDAIGDYAHWDKKKLLEDFEKGRTAKLFGYNLFKGQWGNRTFATKSKNRTDFIVGRVMKYIGNAFETKLKFIKKKKAIHDNEMKVVDVYLESDEEKSEPISAICFVNNNTENFTRTLIAIESGNWLKQNVFKSEVPRYSNNRIYSGKGIYVYKYVISSLIY